MRLMQGNEACALAALQAGCNFFAGYPITPSTEIMEWMAKLLPGKGGVFLQMEDELSAMAALVGGAWAGARTMTATSGPGFSLMQENLGYAAMTETPCVVVNSQRGGPSTGLPTKPSQADVMQSRWGTHGDRAAIVLSPSSVHDTYVLTAKAFEFSERYRVPVVLLLDATLSHMRENVEVPEIEVAQRRAPLNVEDFEPFGSPEFLAFGQGKRLVVTGLAHGPSGMARANDGKMAEHMLRRSIDRIAADLDQITLYNAYHLDDAKVVIISYGLTSRATRAAVQLLRAEGLFVGLLDLQTLWPFPHEFVARLAGQVEAIVVPELNLGQLVMPVAAAVAGEADVIPMNRADGELFTPHEVVDVVRQFLHQRFFLDV